MRRTVLGTTRALGIGFSILLAATFFACGDDELANSAPSRDELESQYQDAVDEIDREINDLRDDLESAPDDASRDEIQAEIDRLQGLREDARAELDEVITMADEEFNRVRDQIADELGDLRGQLPDIFE